MPVSEKQKQWAKEHQQKLDDIRIRPPKGTKARWQAEAERRGQSLSRFVIDTVDKEIERGE